MDPKQMQVLAQLLGKHQAAIMNIAKMVKNNEGSDEELGKQTRAVLNDILNISVKDFL